MRLGAIRGGLEGSFTAGRSEIAYLIEPFSSLSPAELAARCGASAASAPHHFVLAEAAHRKYATGEAVEGERLLLDVLVPHIPIPVLYSVFVFSRRFS